MSLERETVFARNEKQGTHGISKVGFNLMLLLCCRSTNGWQNLIGPSAFQLVEINNKDGFCRVFRIEHDTHPVAYFRMTEYLMLSHGLNNIVGYGIAAIVRQEHQHGVGTAVAGKTVNHLVAW